MDFQKISDSEEELQLLEAKKLYPPRFVITITGSNNAENSLVSFIFEGATQEIAKQISLKKGIIHVVTKLLFDIYGMIITWEILWKLIKTVITKKTCVCFTMK